MLGIGSKITFVKKLGKGGYGRVHRCRNEHGNEFAIKTIKLTRERELDKEEEGIPCLMEASIMACFIHPNIQSALFIYPTPLKLYIISEIAQCDLSKYARKIALPTSQQLIYWTQQITQALCFLHQQGIRHCDVKAANILLFENDLVRVNDFSLASQWYDDPTISYKHPICTYTHRPLEVWYEREWDHQVDVWSWGCTIVEAAIGYCPFPDQDDEQANEIRTKERSVNCIASWAQTGPEGVQENNYPTYETDFHPYDFGSFGEQHPDLAPLVYAMLRIDPQRRIKMSELSHHPLLAEFPVTNLKIKLSVDETRGLSRKDIARMTLQIRLYTQSPAVIKKTLELYRRCLGLHQVESYRKLMACMWISGKLIHRTPIFSNVPSHHLLHDERLICSYLSFHLH